MAGYRHAVKTNCTFCGTPFESTNLSKVCPFCDENMEEYFSQISEYLCENPQAIDDEISCSLNLPVKIVAYYFKKAGPRRAHQNRQSALRCPECNTLLVSGAICVQCNLLNSQCDSDDSYIRTAPVGKPMPYHSSRKS